MNLSRALSFYSTKHIDELKKNYDRRVDIETLPEGVITQGESFYEKDLQLKHALHEAWLIGNARRKEELISYYITTWGKIRTNAKDTLLSYCNAPQENLISKGKSGITSWSKALCIYDPTRYSNFDARVSCALNALQIVYNVSRPCLFPALPTKNEKIMKANRFFIDLHHKQQWHKLNNKLFYEHYLKLINSALESLWDMPGVEISTIEMLLSFNAEDLIENAYKEKILSQEGIDSEIEAPWQDDELPDALIRECWYH